MRYQFSDSQSDGKQDRRSQESYSKQPYSKYEQEYKGQNLTNYPISRLQAFRMFKVPIQYGRQKVFWPQYCPDIIEDSLDQMAQYGYDFYIHYLSKGFKKRERRSYMRRKVKAKFHCEICSRFFTSILGNFQVSFRLDRPPFDIKMKKQITSKEIKQMSYHLRLYKMKCQKCQNFCDGAIYSSQLEAVAKSFCVILAEKMDGIPPPVYYDDRKKLNQDMHKHRAELCQACQKGICFNKDKNAINANRIKENTDHVSHSSEEESITKEEELKPKEVKIYKHRDYQNWQKKKQQEKAKSVVYRHSNHTNWEGKLEEKKKMEAKKEITQSSRANTKKNKIISWDQFIQTDHARVNQNDSDSHTKNKYKKEFHQEQRYYEEQDYYGNDEYSDYGSEYSEDDHSNYQKKNLPLTQNDFPSLVQKKPIPKMLSPVVQKNTKNKTINTTKITSNQANSKKINQNQKIVDKNQNQQKTSQQNTLKTIKQLNLLYEEGLKKYEEKSYGIGVVKFIDCYSQLTSNYPKPTKQQISMINELQQKTLLSIGKSYLELKRWERGLKYLELLLKKYPNNVNGVLVKVMCLFQGARYDEAQKDLLKLIKSNKSQQNLNSLLLAINQKQAEIKKINENNKNKKQQPKSEQQQKPAIKDKSKTQNQIHVSDNKGFKKTWQNQQTVIQNKDPSKLKKHPNKVDDLIVSNHYQRGLQTATRLSNESNQQNQKKEQSTRRKHNQKQQLVRVDSSHPNIKTWAEALDYYNQILVLNPSDKDAFQKRIDCLYQLGQYEAALSQAKKIATSKKGRTKYSDLYRKISQSKMNVAESKTWKNSFIEQIGVKKADKLQEKDQRKQEQGNQPKRMSRKEIIKKKEQFRKNQLQRNNQFKKCD